jgi:hypothetical protein
MPWEFASMYLEKDGGYFWPIDARDYVLEDTAEGRARAEARALQQASEGDSGRTPAPHTHDPNDPMSHTHNDDDAVGHSHAKSSAKKKGLSGGAAAGIVIAIVLVGVVGVVLFVKTAGKGSGQRQPELYAVQGNEPEGSVGPGFSEATPNSNA